jgi:hypothetical protein
MLMSSLAENLSIVALFRGLCTQQMIAPGLVGWVLDMGIKLRQELDSSAVCRMLPRSMAMLQRRTRDADVRDASRVRLCSILHMADKLNCCPIKSARDQILLCKRTSSTRGIR